MDPRVKASRADLTRQLELSQQLAGGIRETSDALARVRTIRGRLKGAPAGSAQEALDKEAAALEGAAGGFFGGAADGEDSLSRVQGQLQQLYEIVIGADAAPTSQAVAAIEERRAALGRTLARASALQARADALPAR
jgi:hypothetical protein